jgi:hypothetical protein
MHRRDAKLVRLPMAAHLAKTPSHRCALYANQFYIPHRLANALRQKTNFSRRFNLIWVVQSGLEKYFALSAPQITSIFRPSRPT